MGDPNNRRSLLEPFTQSAIENERKRMLSQQSRFLRAQGHHEPCCGGRCLIHPISKPGNCLHTSLILLLIPSAVFFALVIPTLPPLPSIAFGSVTGVLCALSVYLMIQTHITEPGILEVTPSPENDRYLVLVDGVTAELSSFRAKFCRETDSCIERFDHFCPWIGNAVGRRNYHLFVFLLTSLSFFITLVNTACVLAIWYRMDPDTQQSTHNFFHAARDNVAATVVCVYGLVISALVMPLWAYHLHLVSHNKTTNDSIKGRFKHESNPYDKGCFGNCVELLCTRPQGSRVTEDRLHTGGV